jgi:hypothetical protein
MRLHRHDEIVEAMALAIAGFKGWGHMDDSTHQKHLREDATAALDAMLEAVVRLEVGKEGLVLNGVETDAPVYVQALILKLEPKHTMAFVERSPTDASHIYHPPGTAKEPKP